MTSSQPLLPHAQAHGRSPVLKRKIPLLITCLGIVVVIASQYSASSRATLEPNTAITIDDFIADSIVEFRKNTPEEDNRENDDESIEDENQPNENVEDDESVDGDFEDDKKPNENGEDDEPGLEYNGTPLHVVFSTSCHDQMHWESFVFFYHAWKVQQPGTVTRIASGCTDKEAEEARIFHKNSIKTMSDRFYLHLTPDFSKQRLSQTSDYKYMNKPFGLRSWMETVLQMNETNRPEGVEDGVVILMDPDMVLLRPLLHDFSNEDVIYAEENPRFTMVKHGHPMAQQDGYLGNEWMYKVNRTFVTGDPTLEKPIDKEGPIHWNTGPPYLATVKDMYDIATLWTEYAPRVDHDNPGLFAEMYAWHILTDDHIIP
jgi:hypothetical protein